MKEALFRFGLRVASLIAALACATSAGAEQGRSQAANFDHDGYHFVIIDRTASFPMPADTDTGQGDVRQEFSYPQIKQPLNQNALLFNDQARLFAVRLWNSLSAKKSDKLDPAFGDPKADQGLDLAVTAGLVSSNESAVTQDFNDMLPGVISISFVGSFFEHGGVHGGSFPGVFNWLLKQRRLLVPSDLFVSGSGWQGVLFGLVQAQQPPGIIAQAVKTDPLYIVAGDSSRWLLTKTALEIVLTDNEFLHCECGGEDAVVIIPWRTVLRYIRHDGVLGDHLAVMVQ